MDKVLRELCGMTKGVDERINRIAEKVYVGKCAGSHSVGRLQKKWIDTVKECF